MDREEERRKERSERGEKIIEREIIEREREKERDERMREWEEKGSEKLEQDFSLLFFSVACSS